MGRTQKHGLSAVEGKGQPTSMWEELVALLERVKMLEDLLLRHREALAQNTGVPFIRLVYAPQETREMARRLTTLQRTLVNKGVPITTVSCRGAIFAHYEERGRLEALFELERQGQPGLGENIAKHGRRTLKDWVIRAAAQLDGDGVVFVTDTAFIYPYFQLGPVLEACTNVIIPPMALVALYPGTVDGEGRVSFLGQRPSGYYRARTLV